MAEAASTSSADDVNSGQTTPGAFILTRDEKSELLVCVKCCKLALQPVLVGSCLHTLCFRCAAGHSQKTSTASGDGSGFRDGSLACPRCGDGGGSSPEADSGGRTSASEPKPNYLAELLSRALGASRSDAPCDFCDESDNGKSPAARWCVDCGKYACLPCSSWHDKFNKSHRSRHLSAAATLSESGGGSSDDDAGMVCEVCSESDAAKAATAVGSVAVSWCEPCGVAMCRQCSAWHDKFQRGHKKVALQPGDSVVRLASLLPKAAAASSRASPRAAATAAAAAASAADAGKGNRRSAFTKCRQHDLPHEYFCDSCDALKCEGCIAVCRDASHPLCSVVLTGREDSGSGCPQLVQRTHDATLAVRAAQAALAAAVSTLDNQAAAASELKQACADDCAMLARNKRLVLDAVERVFEKAEQTVRRRYEAMIERADAALAATTTTAAAAAGETAAATAADGEDHGSPDVRRGRPSLREAAGHALSYVRVLLHLASDPALVLDQQRLILSRMRSLTDRLTAAVMTDDGDVGGHEDTSSERPRSRQAVRPATELVSIEQVLEQLAGLHSDKQGTSGVGSDDAIKTGRIDGDDVTKRIEVDVGGDVAKSGRAGDSDQVPEQPSVVQSQPPRLLNSQRDDEDYWSEENRRPGSRLVPRNPGATRLVVNQIEEGPGKDTRPSLPQLSAAASGTAPFAGHSRDSGAADVADTRPSLPQLSAAASGTAPFAGHSRDSGAADVADTRPSLPQLSAAASGTAPLAGHSRDSGAADVATADAKVQPLTLNAADHRSSGDSAVCIPAASRTFDVRGDCRDVAITDDGRVLLAALTKGMRQYSPDGRQLPTWRPPRSGGDKACVSTVEVLSDGRAAVGIINQSVVVLLRRLASSPGMQHSADAASDAWSEEARIRLNSKPYRMASHGDCLAVTCAHTSERRMDAGVLAVMVSTQCGPGPDLDFVSTTERRVLKKQKLDYNVIGVALAGAAADTFVVASSEKQLTSDGRWHFVIDAYNRDSGKRLWRHTINEEVYDMIVAPVSSTSAAATGVASWILYVMLPESRRVAAVDGTTGEWLVDAYRCSGGGAGGKSNSNSLRSPVPKPVRLAATRRRDQSAIAAILYLNDSVSVHDFLG